MNKHSPIKELLDELRRAELRVLDQQSVSHLGLLEFTNELPIEFNGYGSLILYDQFLDSKYMHCSHQFKSMLQSATKPEYLDLLLHAKIGVEELKQEFRQTSNDISLMRVRVVSPELIDPDVSTIEPLKKKRSFSLNYSIATAGNYAV